VCWAPSEALREICATHVRKSHEHLRQFVALRTRNDVRPECVVFEGAAADHVLSFAREHAVDLIVMGTHGRRGINRWMLGSVTQRVVRHAPCPVLVLREPAHELVVPRDALHSAPLRQILCCTDFSELSAKTVRHARSISEEHAATLTLLHVLPRGGHAAPPDEHAADAMRQFQRLLSPSPSEHCTVTTAVRSGRAHEAIVAMQSDTSADLTVMGVHGRHALDVAVFGSTTYRVIQTGSCPVLVVPA
jgi:nucleotide-binding universal stress UspA family protein